MTELTEKQRGLVCQFLNLPQVLVGLERLIGPPKEDQVCGPWILGECPAEWGKRSVDGFCLRFSYLDPRAHRERADLFNPRYTNKMARWVSMQIPAEQPINEAGIPPPEWRLGLTPGGEPYYTEKSTPGNTFQAGKFDRLVSVCHRPDDLMPALARLPDVLILLCAIDPLDVIELRPQVRDCSLDTQAWVKRGHTRTRVVDLSSEFAEWSSGHVSWPFEFWRPGQEQEED